MADDSTTADQKAGDGTGLTPGGDSQSFGAIKDIIRSTMDAADSAEGAGESEGDKATAPRGAAPESTGERARDEQGRFARKDTEADDGGERKPPPQPSPAGGGGSRPVTEIAATGQAQGTASPASAPADTVPVSWSQDAKAQWASLPPAIQAAVLKREREVSDGFKQKSEELRRYADLEQIIGPRRQALAGRGYQSDGQVINHLFTLSDAFDRDPGGTIRYLAQTAGIDLATLAMASPQDASPQAPAYDPRLLAHLNGLTQTVSSLQSSLAAQESERLSAQISAFSQGKPHFDKVRQVMGRLMQAGISETMDDAYQRAVAMDADLQAQIGAKAQADAQEATRIERQKRAATSVRGSPPGGNGAAEPKGKSVRELVSELAAGQGNRL